MTIRYGVLTVAVVAMCVIAGSIMAQDRTPPPWAYIVMPPPPPGTQPPPDDGTIKRLPGTSQGFTVTQLGDLFTAPDWRPDEHPAMPDIVARGRKPDVFACGYCHMPNGQGRPENSSLAGLPAAYIVQQMADYKNGLRKSAEPRMRPPALMVTVGKNTTEAESKIAAEYFAGLKYKPWIKVVEADTVPKTHVALFMLVPLPDGGTEPIGQRIIEVPQDVSRTELRDPASGFVAYVPPGSIKKGEALVTTGGDGRTMPCGPCHGADLKGLDNVPPLAGRSPTYTVRQLYDMQSGARPGPGAQHVKDTIAKLTIEDMVAIAAYTASLAP